MPCHHDFLKMSHHGANTKYSENTSFTHQESIFRPKTALMLLYLATFTNLTLNDIQKDVFCLVFKNVPPLRTVMVGHTWNYHQRSSKFFKCHQNVYSKCLIKMFYQDVSSKGFINMSHQNVSSPIGKTKYQLVILNLVLLFFGLGIGDFG